MDPGEDHLPLTGGGQQPRVAPAPHKVPVPQVQQLLPEKEMSEDHVHHPLHVWFPREARDEATLLSVEETVPASLLWQLPWLRAGTLAGGLLSLLRIQQAVLSLRSRECGLYEASDLLLGDHLCGKSQTVKWIDMSQPQQRKRRLLIRFL